MCASKVKTLTQTERQEEKDRNRVFLTAELWLRLSQGHPLTYDIHGARLSLSLGRSPSAPADKTGYSANSMQTPQLCIVDNIQQLHKTNIPFFC